jgi:hypothetical protein
MKLNYNVIVHDGYCGFNSPKREISISALETRKKLIDALLSRSDRQISLRPSINAGHDHAAIDGSIGDGILAFCYYCK